MLGIGSVLFAILGGGVGYRGDGSKNFDGGTLSWGRVRVLRGVAGAASRFLGYASE